MANGTLEEFKARRAMWIECLDSDDPHSIFQQIYRMIWDAAAFRVINEALRIAPPAKDGKDGAVQRNGMVYGLLDKCFFESQMLAIRRLTDTYPITGDCRNRDVFSLTSLLRDMQKHAHLITRENVFAAENLEYEVQAHFVPKELDWERLKLRHEDIDFLSGVTAERRKRVDPVRTEVLGRLEHKVEKACNSIHSEVDKFVAHAATPSSRQGFDRDKVGITLGHIWQAHEVICTVANFIDIYMLTGTSHGFLANPQCNHFKYIDLPLVEREAIPALKEIWDSYNKDTFAWEGQGIKNLKSELASQVQSQPPLTPLD